MKKKIVALLFSIFSITLVASQNKYPQNYFSQPLENPMILAGTFGELRTGHFHSGIDFKTLGKEGLNVHSAAEGYVSRIKISLWGYGKALYITHPNGYTTVYAHLKKFNKKIEEFVKKRQYQKESFDIHLFPNKTELPIAKNEIIAFSGNTGSSSAPHLHFEIRNSKTEKIINPMHFGLIPKDTKAPIISHLRAYAFNDSSHVNLSNIPLPIQFRKIDAKKHKASPIKAYGKIGFSINTYDRQDGATNKNGVYKIEMISNGKTVYEHQLETFSFAESKYLNLLIDYPYYSKIRRKYQKTHIHPRSKLSIFKNTKEKGYLTIKEGRNYQIELKITDFVGNSSSMLIPVIGSKQAPKILKKKEKTNYFIDRNKIAKFELNGVAVEFPKNTFYDNLYLNFKVKNNVATIHEPNLPLDKYYNISFNVTHLSDSIKKKSYIANVVNKKYFNFMSTQKLDTLFKTRTKTLGDFTIHQDFEAPLIYKPNFYQGQNISNYRYLSIHTKDKLTGLKSFRAEIDGQWILMEYNTKTYKLTYDFNDKEIKKGKHTFTVVSEDNVGNTKQFSSFFYTK
ncbi:M23 family metallopeptidase [Flavicella sediminum]|uniref:M23 family metallopeptidase n=1 Tax=Flavicella sediminum TaxID=2585141 RepID=UPI001121BE67|nr:M23 family metallopeptidase [Flavicella sediminum]